MVIPETKSLKIFWKYFQKSGHFITGLSDFSISLSLQKEKILTIVDSIEDLGEEKGKLYCCFEYKVLIKNSQIIWKWLIKVRMNSY